MQELRQASEDAIARIHVVDDAEIEAIDRANRQRDAASILERLPDFVRRPRGTDLADRVNPEVRAKVRGWSPQSGSLVILGPTRIGKTSAAGFLFRREVARGVHFGGSQWRMAGSMHWFSATDLEKARKEHPLGKGDAPEIISACYASVLFVDDVGWDRDPAAVTDVLAKRYELCRPTVITSALTRSELTGSYGAAAVRRLVEAGGLSVTIVDAHGGKNG